MARLANDGGKVHLGEKILSFEGALLRPISGEGPQDWGFGLKFVLNSGKTRVVKMFRPHLAKLCAKLRSTLMSIPGVDERAQVRSVLESGSEAQQSAYKAHPLLVHFGKIPDVGDLSRESGNNEYVKLVVADIYPDRLTFDITFLDRSTERFSMASSVGVVFLERCEAHLSSMPTAG